MRTFEAVYGPKSDKWLEYTVGGLLTTIGTTQILSRSDGQLDLARMLGVGTTGTLLAVDLVNVPRRRISRMYLQEGLRARVPRRMGMGIGRRRTSHENPNLKPRHRKDRPRPAERRRAHSTTARPWELRPQSYQLGHAGRCLRLQARH